MSRAMRIALALIGLALASCAPAEKPADSAAAPAGMADKVAEAAGLSLPPRSAAPDLDRNRAACLRLGGSYQPAGRAGYLSCVLTYADAGKACMDGADCEGDCRAEASATTGPATCQANTDKFGCYAVVEQGKVAHSICVD